MNNLPEIILLPLIALFAVAIIFFGATLLLSRSSKTPQKKEEDEKETRESKPLGKTLSSFPWFKTIVFLFLIVALWLGWNNRDSIFTQQRSSILAPLAPVEFTVEPGSSSPIFRLNQGGWDAYINPVCEIAPYVVLLNERTIDGVRYFDAYQIIASDTTLIFSTWQQRRQEGQSPTNCDD